MNTKERLKKFCSQENITVKAFEASINVSNGYVNSISKGIGREKLALIVEKYPNLSIEWLLTGNGSMMRQQNEGDIIKNKTVKVNEGPCRMCEEKDKRIEELKEQIEVLKDQVRILKKISNQ